MSRPRTTAKVIRLPRRNRPPTAAEHRANILRSVIRHVAKLDGAESVATLLNVEAGRLWPANSKPEAVEERERVSGGSRG